VSGQEWRLRSPCQANPDLWFSRDRRELGRAVHECLSHCPRLAECHETEARPAGGVLAGVHYIVVHPHKPPVPERRTLHEVPCDGCELDTKPEPPKVDPSDTGACGTPKGFHRHHKRDEKPCERCRLAKTEYQREKYRAFRRRVWGAA
jgi:hypothetical protein